MYRLYFCNLEDAVSFKIPYEIIEKKPGFFKAWPTQKLSSRTVAVNVYWWLVTRGGGYRIWCVVDREKVIHTSYVVPKCSKFAFLEKGSFCIGPCRTEAEYRGQGIYPAVLSAVVKKVSKAYVIVNDDNLPSVRGIIKSGFSVLPGYVKCTKLKKWVHIKEEQQ